METFGMKARSRCRTTLSLWNTHKVRSHDRAPSSEIHLADVMATRKMVFRSSHLRPVL